MPIFSLQDAKTEQVKNIEYKNFAYWSESATYGYFLAGYTGAAYLTNINRINFSDETVSIPQNNLPTNFGSRITGLSNASYGYVGGSQVTNPTTYRSVVNRLDFSNETVSDPGSRLHDNKYAMCGNASQLYGYFGGGYKTPFGSYFSVIDRLDFSTDLIARTTNLPSERSNASGITSPRNYAYFIGGRVSTSITTVSRLDFSNETVSDLGTIPTRSGAGVVQNTYTYGYFAGGEIIAPLSTNQTSTVTRLDYATEIFSNLDNNLAIAREGLEGVFSFSYGYFGGGDGAAVYSTISRLDFSNETVSDSGNNLPAIRTSLGSFSGGAAVLRGNKTYGYFAGGFRQVPNSRVSTIDRLDFSTETVTVPTPTLPSARSGLAAISNNSYGYFGGGATPFLICTIDRLDFSNETISTPIPKLPKTRNLLTATSSSSYGYFGGGFAPGYDSTIDRLDFSTETVTTPSPKLSSVKADVSATSSSSYGYFGGGYFFPTTYLSTINRLDFSTETVSTPTSILSTARSQLAATSSSSYGYFGGGRATAPAVDSSIIDRLDFSTETRTTPGTYQLSLTRNSLTATSSSSYGYFAGGASGPGSIDYSTIDRLDFSTETRTTPAPKLSTAKYALASVSNSN